MLPGTTAGALRDGVRGTRDPRAWAPIVCGAALLLALAACKGDRAPEPAPAAPAAHTDAPEAAPEPAAASAEEPEAAKAAAAERMDPAALVTPAALAKELDGDAPILLDVRGDAAWQAGHLRGSLPLPAYALKTSAPVRAGRVVVVDEGYGARAVEEVTALRADGRDVRLLDGGMARWCREGREVDGSCAGVDLIPAAAVLADLGCSDRVTLVALRNPEATERAARLLPGARTAVWTDPADLAAALAPLGAPRTLVVVGEDTAAADALRNALAPASAPALPLVLVADGGLEAVDQMKRVQVAAGSHPALVTRGTTRATGASSPVRTPKGCGCR